MTSLVIKAKYEDTLRRFTVGINEDKSLDLNMEGLRQKICSLFNLQPNADFRLTYIDEDGDLVTLGDDEDLHDVVRQGLDPVRITVVLNKEKSSHTTNGSSTPARPLAEDVHSNISKNVAEALSSVQKTLAVDVHSNISKNVAEALSSVQKINPDVAEVLKSVQDPLSQALSKLSLEMSSKAASASPMLADLFDGLSKIGQSYLNAAHSHSGTSNGSSHNDVGNEPETNSESRKMEAPADEGTKQDGIHTSNSAKPIRKSSQTSRGKDLAGPSVHPYLFEKGTSVNDEHPSVYRKVFSSDRAMKEFLQESAEKNAVLTAKRDSKPRVTKASKKESCTHENRGFQYGGNWSGPFCKTTSEAQCPFLGVPVSPFYDAFSPNRNFSKADRTVPIFHKGVRCDGCGVLPITGPRFKSKVKYDYDLCNICFLRMGNDADYTKIDIPLSIPHPKVINLLAPIRSPHKMRPHCGKHLRSKLDSRFIMDVNVMDGTTMAPSTPFTKIWRMRNNGTLPWHRGLRLMWIGGDRFSPNESIEIEVPVDGVNVGSELDIAVDFVAPELPGRYISYWRMSEPSGHKFGQRVWVLVQVDASVDLTRESTPILNLNLPPDSIQGGDVKAEPPLDVGTEDSSAPPTVKQDSKAKTEMKDLNFPINDDLLVDTDVVCPSPDIVSPVASDFDHPLCAIESSPLYPTVDGDSFQKPAAPSAPYPAIFGVSSGASSNAALDKPAPPLASYPVIFGESSGASSDVSHDKLPASAPLSSYPIISPDFSVDNNKLDQMSEENGVEENLLKELEHMGFRQVDLNKEVLRMNEYDLDRSVDDLCGVSEWDPILEELQEMGFQDKETNKKLLAKNNGSITRVVMDLIADEKA